LRFLESFRTESGYSENGLLSASELEPLERHVRQHAFSSADCLRIMLVGEFKAGKSTLINALLGKEYAAVDILEMTSWIARYLRSDRPFCRMCYLDGSESELSPDEFLHRTSTRSFSPAELSRIDRVDIGVTGAAVPFMLIDTPGLGSVTRENERRLVLALDNSDVLLWAVDVTSIGGAREAALARKLVESNVPRYAVITKCDELDGDGELEVIIDTVADMLGLEPRQVLTTSAASALKQIQAGETPSESTGIPELMRVLTRDVAVRRKELREQAERAHDTIIREHAAGLLDKVVGELEGRREKVNNFTKIIELARDRVQVSFEDDVIEFVRKNMFGGRQGELATEIKSKIMHNHPLSHDALTQIFAKHLGANHLDEFWRNVTNVVASRAAERWSEQIENVEASFKQDFESVQRDAIVYLAMPTFSQLEKIVGNEAETTFVKAANTSLGIAGVATAYVAWLGPAAGSISLGAAVLGVGLPIAAIGMGVAYLYAHYKRNEAAKAASEEAPRILDEYVETFIENALRPGYFPKIRELNSQIASNLIEKFRDGAERGLPGSLDETLDTAIRLQKLV
jgi:ribosome biogenesis GTPase A